MSEIPPFLVELETAFNVAMVSNDVARIAACISDDWVLVTPEVGPISRAAILGAIAQGRLTHSMMTKAAASAKVIGDVALITSRCRNSGTFQGSPIEADEWVTDVYALHGGEWRCVLTHLTPAAPSRT